METTMTLRFPTRFLTHFAALALAVLACAGCRDFVIDEVAPDAVAGDDQAHDASPVDITLDGTDSTDADGEIVSYEWYYTGDPRGDEGLDADSGLAEVPIFARPLPSFCPPFEMTDDNVDFVPQRWCLVGDGSEVEVAIDDDGVYRFTLYVTDDDGRVSADSVVVYVGVPVPEEP